MDLHLVIKYQFYAWNLDDNSVETMSAHLDVQKTHGATWWGRVNTISLEKVELLKRQIADKVPTYAFLYATAVPKSIHEDGNLWYIARVKDIYVGTPVNKELIPEYYREVELAIAFLIEDIKPLHFAHGSTPKVPGQASLRYVNYRTKPRPEELLQAGKDEFLCMKHASTSIPQTTESHTNSHTLSPDTADLRDRVISLQDQVIELKDEVRALLEYKIQYQKILNADYLFNSEKFFETWLEENIHKVADNLMIIDRQPNARWSDGKFGRLDLLAMNKETKDLVIIEVKTRKRDKKSGYDQFLRYTTWARKNLKDLEATYSLQGLKPTKDLSFMIVTDLVDEEMSEICREHGIALLKVFGGLGFEKVA